MELIEIVAMLGVVIGVLFRAYFPYLKKLKEAEEAGEQVSFKPKYIVSALVSLLVTAVSALYALSAFTMPEADSVQGLVAVFTFGMSYGYAFTGGLNLALDVEN